MDESVRARADQTFARTTGAPLVPGNTVRILKDGKENYPAWLEAIAGAKRTIHFESYAIHGDEVGLEFADALAERARNGVRVRVLCDWFGSLNFTTRRVWPVLAAAGVEARSFNPPRFDSPFGWLSRDHRKVITIDGRLAFVSGLCVGRDWVGDPERHVEPWRDTGIAVEGPAVADIDRAFADTWAIAGAPIPAGELPDAIVHCRCGERADARRREHASGGGTVPAGSTHRRRRAPFALADRRILCEHHSLCAGLEIGGHGRRGCPASRSGRRGRPLCPIAFAGRISPAPGGWRPCVRVEWIDVARENRCGRLPLGESRFDEPQSHQLDRQLGAGCCRARALRGGDGTDVPGRPVARY